MGWVRRLAKRVLGRAPRSDSVLPTAPAPDEPTLDGARFATLTCSPQELLERTQAGETVVVVDVREASERAVGALPDDRHIPLHDLPHRWPELQDADEIVCYSTDSPRAERAARLLRNNGLINATALEGGFNAWQNLNGPTTTP